MIERELVCRRCAASAGGGPFALPGAQPYYVPDRVCDMHHLRVEVALDFGAGRVDGNCTLTVSPIDAGAPTLTLDAVEMTIERVTVAGAPTPFDYDGAKLRVPLGERRAGERLDVAVAYHCQPRRGLYFIRPDEHYPHRPVQAWSQGQDEDNRCWFPCFDHPNAKATSEVWATVPAQSPKMTVLSNGRLEGVEDKGELRTFRFMHDVPHSSYLITLVAGEFTLKTEQARGVELRTYLPPGREADAPRTFARTGEMIALFEEKIGVHYPYRSYSQVCVAEFIFGGMENTSATTLTDETLHDERAHLDFSSDPLISHELAHQWFGDLVTCRDWSQGWLNEGFATYMEIVWKEHAEGADEADWARLFDQEAYLDEDAERYRRPIVANVFHAPIDVFDRHLYEKGGCVLHMLRHRLGEARFWKAIRHYVTRHARGSVESRDLARAVDEATGVNVDRFFDQWVFGSGYPDLKVDYSWDDEAKLARVHVKQAQEPKDGTPIFELPLVVRFVVSGEERDVRLQVAQAEETFLVPLAGKPTQAVIDPGNHLLKRLDAKKPDEVWRGELSSARHAIDRALAARALGKGGDPINIPALAEALARDPFWAVRGEAAAALGKLKTDAARDALLGAAEGEKHPKARRAIVRALGAFRHDEKAGAALVALLGKGDASYFVEAEMATALAKTRSPAAFAALEQAMVRPSYREVIRSACLGGFAELRDERGLAIALAELAPGKPLPSRRAAIAALAHLADEHQAHKRRALDAIIESLDDPDFRVRIAAVDALDTLADRRALGPLGRLAKADLDGRVRRRAREVARAIEDGLRDKQKVSELRDQLEKLREDADKLRERVLKLEEKK